MAVDGIIDTVAGSGRNPMSKDHIEAECLCLCLCSWVWGMSRLPRDGMTENMSRR